MSVLALDCEMVGVKEKSQYTTSHSRCNEPSFLARVSIVDENGVCIYDKFEPPFDAEVAEFFLNGIYCARQYNQMNTILNNLYQTFFPN